MKLRIIARGLSLARRHQRKQRSGARYPFQALRGFETNKPLLLTNIPEQLYAATSTEKTPLVGI